MVIAWRHAVLVSGLSWFAAGCTFSPDAASSLGPPDAARLTDVGFIDAEIPPKVDSGVVSDDKPDLGVMPDAGLVTCGDGFIDLGEACDDEGVEDGDGCSSACQIEPGYQCFGEPSMCELIPRLQIEGVDVDEGQPAVLSVNLDRSSQSEVRFLYETVDGAAGAPDDYIGTSGLVRLLPGATSTVVSIDTRFDRELEGDEEFEVVISRVVGATTAVERVAVGLVDVLPLVSRGLVARYYLDEARITTTPTVVYDAGPLSFDLRVVRDGEQRPEFFAAVDQSGMYWNAAGANGRVIEDLTENAAFHAALDQTQTATLEAVAYLEDTANASRLIHVGGASELGWLMLGTTPGDIVFAWRGDELARWSTPGDVPDNRAVITLVVDTTLAAEDRLRLYVNNRRILGPDDAPGLDAMLAVPLDRALALGNRSGGSGSPEGDLLYAAIYSVALTEAEIAINTESLRLSDDGPENRASGPDSASMPDTRAPRPTP